MYLHCTELGSPAQHAGQGDPAAAIPHFEVSALLRTKESLRLSKQHFREATHCLPSAAATKSPFILTAFCN